MDFFFQPSIEQLPNVKAAVAFIPDSGAVFREDTRLDTRVLNGGQRFVPWGMDNAMPYDIISKVEDDECHCHLLISKRAKSGNQEEIPIAA